MPLVIFNQMTDLSKALEPKVDMSQRFTRNKIN